MNFLFERWISLFHSSFQFSEKISLPNPQEKSQFRKTTYQFCIFDSLDTCFPTRSQTKISLSKAVTYPRYFFVDRDVEKIKGWLLGQDCPTRITHLRYITSYTSKTTSYKTSKLWLKLNCGLKEVLKVFIF